MKKITYLLTLIVCIGFFMTSCEKEKEELSENFLSDSNMKSLNVKITSENGILIFKNRDELDELLKQLDDKSISILDEWEKENNHTSLRTKYKYISNTNDLSDEELKLQRKLPISDLTLATLLNQDGYIKIEDTIWQITPKYVYKIIGSKIEKREILKNEILKSGCNYFEDEWDNIPFIYETPDRMLVTSLYNEDYWFGTSFGATTGYKEYKNSYTGYVWRNAKKLRTEITYSGDYNGTTTRNGYNTNVLHTIVARNSWSNICISNASSDHEATSNDNRFFSGDLSF